MATGPKRAKPTISRSVERADPFSVATEFAEGSTTFRMCQNAAFPISDVGNFVLTALSNRCRTQKTIRGVSCLAAEFIPFARICDPPLPYYGDQSLIAIQKWLISLASRGFAVSNKGRYSLKVYAEALGLVLPIWHPGILAVVKKPRKSALHQAPPVPVEFIFALERIADAHEYPWGMRYYASMFVLMTMTSLRFCDTRDVVKVWVTETAICGVSVDHKTKNAEPTQWAAPKSGLVTDSLWLAPIARLWKKISPADGHAVNMSPRADGEWNLVTRKVGTHGTAQAALLRLEEVTGFKIKLRIHSPRTFFATCAGQLRFPREEREKLGRWVAGSVMPERYDRSVCVTELGIRNDIINRINTQGWRPQSAFNVQTNWSGKQGNDGTKEPPLSQASTRVGEGGEPPKNASRATRCHPRRITNPMRI